MEWLNNAWVTGIGGGIISGFLVFFATRWLFSNQSKRELNRKISVANQEMILTIRQGIPEDSFPSLEVLNALIKATARKHDLRPEDLYGPSEVGQDLIKEVMDSNFISADTKTRYCKRLVELDRGLTPNNAPKEERVSPQRAEWRARQTALTSFALALTTSVTSLAMVVTGFNSELSQSSLELPVVSSVFLPVAVSMFGAVAAMLVMTWQRRRVAHRTRDVNQRLSAAIATANAEIALKNRLNLKQFKVNRPSNPK